MIPPPEVEIRFDLYEHSVGVEVDQDGSASTCGVRVVRDGVLSKILLLRIVTFEQDFTSIPSFEVVVDFVALDRDVLRVVRRVECGRVALLLAALALHAVARVLVQVVIPARPRGETPSRS